MIVQVCRADGVVIGKFDEADFQARIRHGEFPVRSGQYSYWYEGMTEWKPLSDYKPPGKITKILGEMEMRRQQLKSHSSPPPPSRQSVLQKLTSAFRNKRKSPPTDGSKDL